MTFKTEKEYLAHYNIHDYSIPLATVDLCIFTLHDDQLKVLLVKRSDFPQKGKYALPGGFVDVYHDITLEDTALRKLEEKTGIKTPYLEQLFTTGNHKRDPRGWSITVTYFALIPYTEPSADHTERAHWHSVEPVAEKSLAFDHNELLDTALKRLRSKVLYTLIPAYLIASPFTLTGLQRAYEIILGKEVEKKAFRRRFDHAGVLEPTGAFTTEGLGRPAALFRLKDSVQGFNFARQLSP